MFIHTSFSNLLPNDQHQLGSRPFNSTTASLSALSFRVIILIRVALHYALTLLCYTRPFKALVRHVVKSHLSELFYGTPLQRFLLHWLSDYFNENMSPCVSANIHTPFGKVHHGASRSTEASCFCFVFKTLDILDKKIYQASITFKKS